MATAIAAALLLAYLLADALALGEGLLLPLVARGRDRDAVLARAGSARLALFFSAAAVLALVLSGLPESARPLAALWPVLLALFAALLGRAAIGALRPRTLRQGSCDLATGLASLAAALCQGAVLGWLLGDLPAAGLPTLAPAGVPLLGWLSVWSLLGAVAYAGLCAVAGTGWLLWSGRGAVGTFAREVGRAAMPLFALAALLCLAWAVATGAAAQGLGRGGAGGAGGTVAAVLAAAAFALLVAFRLTLWHPRPALPAACGLLAVALSLAAALAALLPFAPTAPVGRGTFPSYLAVLLLIGAPLVVADLLRRRRGPAAASQDAPPQDRPSHAGRRSGSLANALHLS